MRTLIDLLALNTYPIGGDAHAPYHTITASVPYLNPTMPWSLVTQSRQHPYKYLQTHDEEQSLSDITNGAPLLPSSPSSSSIMSSSSLSEKHAYEDEKQQHHATAEYNQVDEAAQLSVQGTVDPAEALRIRCVLDPQSVCQSTEESHSVGRLTSISSL